MKNSLWKSSLVFILLITSFISCKKDPYPGEGSLREEKRREPLEPLPDLSISVDDVLELNEGRSFAYTVRVAVKEPGTPLVNIDNLPPGAKFDPETFEISWTPDYFAGNDMADPGIKSQIYPIKIWLRSSEDPVRAMTKDVNLIVHDVPRAINIGVAKNMSVYEGDTLSKIIEIKNADYPKGPFKLLTKDMPANIDIRKVTDSKFELRFAPDYFHVNRDKDGSELTYNAKVIVSNPANHIVESPVKFVVRDRRLKNELVTPGREITQGLDISMQIAAYDLNKEVSPRIELISTPRFGTFRVEEVQNAESFSTVLNVHWNDIPPGYNGESHTLRYKSCVLDSYRRWRNCEVKSTKINFIVRDRRAPTINRNSWPVDELIYLGFKETLRKRIVVRDEEDPRLSPRVEIFPVEMRKYVKWRNNDLTLKFDKAGVFQFNLVATSEFNVSSSQSFIVEVFPENRNKILLFADSSRDPEVIFYKSTFGNMDIMNPAIQDINQRNISDREILVLTTSTLFDLGTREVVMKAINKIKNIVVASSLIDNLPESFLEKIIRNYDFSMVGRYDELPNMPPLSDMKLVTTSQFRIPQNSVGLKGSATSESSNPMVFNGGLDDPNKNCKGVIGMTSTGNNPYVLGVSCMRDNGGRVSVLGTEWADFKVSGADQQIPVNWFNTMLNGNFRGR